GRRADRGPVAPPRLPAGSGGVRRRGGGSRLPRRRPGHPLLRARHPGADPGGECRRPALPLRRERELRGGASLLGRLPYDVTGRLPRAERGARLVVTDLRREPVMRARGSVLLAIGAGAGIALAATGLVASGVTRGRGLPPGAVARVNGALLRADDYTRSLDALERDRRGGAAPADRRSLLDRLIDEELLVQRGLELGLARQDARVRRDLTAAVIDAVVTEHEDGTPSDADLEAFYRRERDFFARPGRLRVRQLWCRADTAADAPSADARARAAAASLRAGEDFAGVRVRLGDPEIAPLPDALLSPAKPLDPPRPTAL